MFEHSPRTAELLTRLEAFFADHIEPAEAARAAFYADPSNAWVPWPTLESLNAEARAQGLWNLFLPREHGHHSPGLTNLEYAPLAEQMGRVSWSSEVFNCSAPDTGNMEVLAKYGNEVQQEQWLRPLLAGEIRSAFAMTEPQVASSDATNIETAITRDRGDYVINGRKHWISSAKDPRCAVFIVMGKTDPSAPKHVQQSMILVPADAPGVEVVRPQDVLSAVHPPGGHCEMRFTDVRVPAENLILGEGRGFEIAQGRLGPGRIHHSMRQIGAAQRCLELMCQRAHSRVAFGRKLSEHGMVRHDIARSRCEIDQARYLTLAAAHEMDRVGNKAARDLISMITIVGPQMAQTVADRAIQVFGATGLSSDTPIAEIFVNARLLRIADGPDEVHLTQLARSTVAAHGR